jgi:asparagine synthase (glutamine-hydrolysing)
MDPLIDDELLELMASVPPELLLLGGRTRGLFRASLEGLLPDTVRLRRDKSAFEPALARMIAPNDLAHLRTLSHLESLGQLGLVDPEPFRRRFELVVRRASTSPEWLTVWPALAVESFVRQYLRPDGDGRPAIGPPARMTCGA